MGRAGRELASKGFSGGCSDNLAPAHQGRGMSGARGRGADKHRATDLDSGSERWQSPKVLSSGLGTAWPAPSFSGCVTLRKAPELSGLVFSSVNLRRKIGPT